MVDVIELCRRRRRIVTSNRELNRSVKRHIIIAIFHVKSKFLLDTEESLTATKVVSVVLVDVIRF